MTRSIFCYCFLFLVFSGCQPTTTPEPQDNLEDEITAILSNLTSGIQVEGVKPEVFDLSTRMEFYKVPGLSIAIVRGGKLHWARGFGMANTELETSVDENTIFQAGSISKPLAAMGALKLVEAGKLSLEEDINRYLSSWKIPENEFQKEEKVTLARLLSHQAGISVHGFPGYTQDETFPSDIEVLDGLGNTDPIRVDTRPGTLWRYSGGGYTIMERAVEDQSGMSFSDYLDTEVLRPLGMERSTYAQPLPKAWHENASAAYNADGEIAEGYWNNYPEQAAAGLWTTPTDLARYCIEVMEAHRGESSKVLSQDMIKAMLTEQPLNWGLGPSLGIKGDSLRFGHGGKNRGFTNNMVAFDYLQDAIIVMTSADRGMGLIREIQRAAAEAYGWELSPGKKVTVVEVSAEEKAKRVGSYRWAEEDYTVNVIVEEGEIILVDPNENDRRYLLKALDETKTIDLVDGDEIEFIYGEDGQVEAIVQNGRIRLDRLN